MQVYSPITYLPSTLPAWDQFAYARTAFSSPFFPPPTYAPTYTYYHQHTQHGLTYLKPPQAPTPSLSTGVTYATPSPLPAPVLPWAPYSFVPPVEPPRPPSPFSSYLLSLTHLWPLAFNPQLPPFPLPERNTKLYHVIGVDPGSDVEVVLKRFKTLAMKCHPDKRGEDGEEYFKRVNYVKSVLTDAEKKREYDRFRTSDRMCINLWVFAAAQLYNESAARFYTLVHDVHEGFLHLMSERPDACLAEHREAGDGEVDCSCFDDPEVQEGLNEGYENEIDEDGGRAGSPLMFQESLAELKSGRLSPEDSLNKFWCTAGLIRTQLLQLSHDPHPWDIERRQSELLDFLEQLKSMKEQLNSCEPSLERQMLLVHCGRLHNEAKSLFASLDNQCSTPVKASASHSNHHSPAHEGDELHSSSPAPAIEEEDAPGDTRLTSIGRALKAIQTEVEVVLQEEDLSPTKKVEELHLCKEHVIGLVEEVETFQVMDTPSRGALGLAQQLRRFYSEIDAEISHTCYSSPLPNNRSFGTSPRAAYAELRAELPSPNFDNEPQGAEMFF